MGGKKASYTPLSNLFTNLAYELLETFIENSHKIIKGQNDKRNVFRALKAQLKIKPFVSIMIYAVFLVFQ